MHYSVRRISLSWSIEKLKDYKLPEVILSEVASRVLVLEPSFLPERKYQEKNINIKVFTEIEFCLFTAIPSTIGL